MNGRIEKSNIQDIIELTGIQQGMFFHYLKETENSLYNVQVSFLLEGALQADVLEQAIYAVQAGNEVLRSVFSWEKVSKPLHIILKQHPIDFKYIDLSATQHTAAEYIAADRHQRFDLTVLPIRFTLLKQTAGTYIFSITHHHILYDGWSTALLLKELLGNYHRLLQQQAPEIRVKIPYKEVVQRIKRKRLGEGEGGFWKQYLQGYHFTPLTKDFTGTTTERLLRRKHYSIPAQELEQFSASHKVTKAAVIYAAYALLMYKHRQQADMVFGTTVSCREPEIRGSESVIGNFMNTVPFRVKLEQQTLLSALVATVNNDIIQVNQFCTTSYFDIKQLLRLKPAADLFDVIIAIENYPLDESITQQQTFQISLREVYENTSIPFGIYVFFKEALEIEFVYKTDKISDGFAAEMATRFFMALQEILRNSSKSAGEVSLFTAAERQAIWDEQAQYLPEKLPQGGLTPASYHQERLWFIDRFEAGFLYEKGPVYHNIPLLLRFEGALQPDRLKKSIGWLVQRYDILRTRIINKEETPFQEIHTSEDFFWEEEDLREQPAELEPRLHRWINTAFDLSAALFRAVLIHTATDEYQLLVVFHHAIADRHTVWLLRDELLRNYQALLNGSTAPEKYTGLSYRGFGLWQQESLLKLEPWYLHYWKQYLGQQVKALEIPTDRSRAAIHIYTAASATVHIPDSLYQAVAQVAAQEEVPIRIVWMAAFKMLLRKYCGHDEIVIGTSAANRNTPFSQNVIGPVANLVVLKSDITDESCFRNYLHVLKAAEAQGMSFAAIPFDKLVKELAPGKDMSRTALFDILFQYETPPDSLPPVAGLNITTTATNNGYGKYDLHLLLSDNGDTIQGNMIYNADYFDPGTITTLLTHYITLLGNLLAAPLTGLGELTAIAAEEEQRLLQRFDHTQVSFPTNKTITDLLEEQIVRVPDNIAIKLGDQQVTYAELDRAADRIAACLVSKGVQADTIVALLADRSIDTVIGMVAILRAGGAYLPIDVDYPEERIQYLVQDSGTQLLLTSRAFEEKVPAGPAVIYLEDAADASPDISFARYRNHPADLCYIIYTSGTTGHPKGVMVTHRNVVRLFFNDGFQFDFGPGDVWTMFHSHCFDFSVWEMYGALLFGGRLVIIPKMMARDTAAYLDILREEKVTVLNQTPSAFYNLIREELVGPASLPALRYVIFGGEALSPAKLDTWYERYPRVQLVNMFGITETTVHVTYKEIGAEEIKNNNSNIGKPIPTLSVFLFDQHRQLVPRGVIGELYVGGEGVSRGYLGKPELTARVFVPHPYYPEQRLYKTGDLGRILASGDLEYIGRIDHQVQLRGFRIELGEIEGQLGKYPGVKETVVIAREQEEDKYLIAYYVSATEIAAPALRSFLSGKLPDYMLPSYFVRMEQLPLTSNGKTDRAALPDPQLEAGTGYLAPANDTEVALAAIWAEVLKVPQELISRKASFFELGGHSLKATVLLNKIFKHFQVTISLQEVFTHQDISSLAMLISAAVTATYTPIPVADSKSWYRVTAAQQQLYFLYQLDRSSLAYNMPYFLRLEGIPDPEQLSRAFERLIQRHEILRTRFAIVQGAVMQQVLETVSFSLEQQVAGADITHSIGNVIRPFDLEAAPLFRAGLITGADTTQLLWLDMHHIINDGVSQSVLVQDFVAAYRDEELPPLRLHYKDYAEWQQSPDRQNAISQQRAYWMQTFAEPASALELPADYPRPAVKNYAGHTIHFATTPATTAALKQLAAQEGSTLFMVLLAVYNVWLGKLSNQEDVVIGTPVAGREHADAEKIPGVFINTLPLRNRPVGSLRFRELLANVKASTLESFNNSAYPYEALVEQLQLERDLSRNPLFDVLFLYQNFDDISWDIPGLTLTPYTYQHPVAKLDLTLIVAEEADQLQWQLEYATALFKEETIRRAICYFENIIAAIIAAPDIRIAAIDFLPAAEKFNLLHAFNDTQGAFPEEDTLVSLLAAQVQRTPDKTAVMFADVALTYRELDEQANRLARRLIATHQVGAGQLVAIMLERSEKLLISLLAVLKTGAAYVPVDPSYPAQRVAYILQESKAQVLLTNEAYDTGIADQRAVLWYSEAEQAAYAATAPEVSVSPRDLCYVIYTSGSTGAPKGVMIHHRNVVNFFAGLNDHIEINAHDVMLAVTSTSFDISVLELCWTLCHGISVIIHPADVSLSGLDRYLQAENTVGYPPVTMLQSTPSFIRLLREDPHSRRFLASLQQLMVGGEALPLPLIQELRTENKTLRIYNMYGPTETTIWSCMYPFEAEITTISIGKPMRNTQIYILDNYLQLVPAGVTGALYIGGEGLSSGYKDRPELTLERFIPHPFVPGKNIYNTGDMARWLPDGNLAYAGRKDQQVKIRGFRIELGEIEKCLQDIAGVKEAVVIAGKEKGEAVLMAYVVTTDTPDITFIRAQLSERLPYYMVPPYLIPLEALPLTPNGKLDRLSLPAPGIAAAQEYIAPQTPAEQLLATVFATALEVNRVGMADNFFALGGDSIKSILIISGLQAAGYRLSIKDIFTARQIGELVRKMEQAVLPEQPAAPAGGLTYKGLTAAQLAALQADYQLEDIYPLSSLQEGMLFHAQLNAAASYYFVQLSYQLEGTLDINAVEHSLNGLVRRYAALRTVFPRGEFSRALQVVLRESKADFCYKDVREECRERGATATIAAHQLLDKHKKFDLAQGHLFRLTVLHVSDTVYEFIWSYHHILMDGWCMGIIVQDFKALYLAARHGQDAQLPPVAPYAHYFEWLCKQDHKQSLDFWRHYLAGYESPVGVPRKKKAGEAGAEHTRLSETLTLPATLMEQLRRVCTTQRVTLSTLVQMAWGIVLARYNNTTDVLFGGVVAGRPGEIAGVEAIVGLFINTIPVRVQYQETDTVGSLLRRMQDEALEASAHHHSALPEIQAQSVPGRALLDHLLIVENYPVSEKVQGTTVIDAATGEYYEVSGLQTVDQSNYDFHVVLIPGTDSILRLDYNPVIYDQRLIAHMAASLQQVITTIAAGTDHRIATLEILPDIEKHRILHDFNAHDVVYPTDKTVIGLFEAQVAADREKTAVQHEEVVLSYGALNNQANYIAQEIKRRCPVAGNHKIALLYTPSAEMIAAMLGVLKAGCAYVVLSPDIAAARNEYIVGNCGARLLLIQPAVLKSKPGAAAIIDPELLYEVQLDKVLPDTPAPVVSVLPEDLIYTIYTSGTTGTPKGVEIEHKGLVNMLYYHQALFGGKAGTAMSQVANITFDAAAFEIWPCLTQGGCLHIAPTAVRFSPEDMKAWLIAHQIEITFQPTVIAQHLLEMEWDTTPSALKVLNIAGDRLNYIPAHTFPFRVYNLYGPTEDTIWTTYTALPYAGIREHYLIGKPIPNKRVLILDKNRQLQPVGVAGELCIAGSGLARGYVEDQKKTDEKFITHPLIPGQRLYCTGDYARWLEDGTIEFLGRDDSQVKIRGYRIELGEIEWQLSLYPDILETAVMASIREKEKYLVAYYAAKTLIDETALLKYLREKLPDYMIPACFMYLPKFPVTRNGKVDRKALPEPVWGATVADAPPANQTEEQLVTIWAEMLEIAADAISVNKSFFVLGGHSLTAAKLVSRINHHFGIGLSLQDVFDRETVRQLSDYIITIRQLNHQLTDNDQTIEITI
ncbi:non-ribosomal peptide synthetase [Chitinophaga nivalis]|uniref:Amino acid adenylation domain-containing protein n=1 Tax=Chitinophaga nivalis TaxID=2991709 RepID=A0ABT3IJT5_9BACT|nr:non-ribosomal peptide synthetase [Chitinophaga nivalis]MCW3466087.1 amino acid adenylation domain-containing protein [Chitinophaga nivalis]MCW3484222.1 amino acid adenylation domain-containing protein [Chitinophaga nivalis]